jgi:pimeloyl-ACP methyl ester carboxylesterase
MSANSQQSHASRRDEHEPLVILPGLLCDSRMFAAQIEKLGASVVDGFYGGSDSIEAMASYALDRMPARCALLGHSMGGRVALAVWQRAPERVTRLALASTGVHDIKAGEAEKRFALKDIGRVQGDEALVDAWLPSMIGPSHRQDPSLLAELKAMAVSAGTATYERQVSALLHRPAATSVLATITCPTLVIVGADDSWSPIHQHQAIAAAIGGARLRIIPGAGHMTPAEAPEPFNEMLRDWLSWPTRTLPSEIVQQRTRA